MNIWKVERDYADYIQFAQDTVQWQSFVNTVIEPRVLISCPRNSQDAESINKQTTPLIVSGGRLLPEGGETRKGEKCGDPRIKVKVKLSLCFNWAPSHESVLGEWRYSSTHSLTSAIDGGEWSAWRPGRFTPKERVAEGKKDQTSMRVYPKVSGLSR
jgi:hypothetical protein